jgi:hypothetical protein
MSTAKTAMLINRTHPFVYKTPTGFALFGCLIPKKLLLELLASVVWRRFFVHLITAQGHWQKPSSGEPVQQWRVVLLVVEVE